MRVFVLFYCFLQPLIRLLLVNDSLAQDPSVPHGGGKCESEEDCSLGGECVDSQCVCDVWFTGPSCAFLNLQQPENENVGTCGSNFNTYYSWGGRSVEWNGTYHLFASFMCNHATLDEWTTMSSSSHFVSQSPAGQFSWNPLDCHQESGDDDDDGLICDPLIQPWSHNTVVVQNPPGQSPALLIFHIGDGIVDPSVWSPCFNSSQAVSSPHSASFSSYSSSDGNKKTLNASPGNTAYVQYADSPFGPWTEFNNNEGVYINFTGAWTSLLAGNPSPLIMPDGSVKLYFTGQPCPANAGALAPSCIAVATADTWEGPYSMNASQAPITYPESEDPFVFQDFRGNYHLLTNVNTYHHRCAASVPCGGHAWSRDGIQFSNLTIGAFGPVITFSNGSVWTNSYVERPLMTFNPDGTPLAFHVGMGRSSYADSCNFVQLFCTPNATNCGPTFPPAPTTVRIMNQGLCLMFNESAFPCSDMNSLATCPVVLGDCSSGNGSLWSMVSPLSGTPSMIMSASLGSQPSSSFGLNVDCDSTYPHTIVKVLNTAYNLFTYNRTLGTLIYEAGMCLNTGQGPANPPCGPQGEVWFNDQIQLGSCDDPSTHGWEIEIV